MPVENQIQPVLLCGGSGTRLWPLSRNDHPKQFLKLFGERSLLQETLLRAQKLEPTVPPLIVGSREHRSLLDRDLAELRMTATVLLEPSARNTAPALAQAALYAARTNPQELLAVMPSDHYVADSTGLVATIRNAIPAAKAGAIVIFGIRPTSANTGYGYIQKGRPSAFPELFQVSRFLEKPDAETANHLLADGGYLWNAGIFLQRADVYLDQLNRYAPDILDCAREAASNSRVEHSFLMLPERPYARCRSESIDNAVMEHCNYGMVAEVNVGWTDVGTWSSVWEVDSEGETQNVTVGDVLLDGVTRSLIHSHSRLVVASGISDQIVIETPDAVLVAPRNRSQRVRDLALGLQKQGRVEVASGTGTDGPHADQELLVNRDGLQVRRLRLQSGQEIAMRAESGNSDRWLVLKGNAEIISSQKAGNEKSERGNEGSSACISWNIRTLGDSPADILWIRVQEPVEVALTRKDAMGAGTC